MLEALDGRRLAEERRRFGEFAEALVEPLEELLVGRGQLRSASPQTFAVGVAPVEKAQALADFCAVEADVLEQFLEFLLVVHGESLCISPHKKKRRG
ncbi:hypothetical protein D3C84_1125480 [compost metagenome]